MNSYSEAEAKTKWCPAARVGVNGAGSTSVNRHPSPDVEEDCRCRGSACMWWRWEPNSRPVPHTQAEKVAAIRAAPQPPTEGYCGAAGR